MMSATLVHHPNPALLQETSGVSIINPIMAVSICRPVMVEGVPSQRGSAVERPRQSSARSLPGHGHFRLLNPGSNPASISLSSSLLQPHPPAQSPSNEKEILSLPKIGSPVQLCSNSNSQTSFVADAAAAASRSQSNEKRKPVTPEKPSTFPNFRALQRLAASAKLRLHNLKSKEAKAITATLNQENKTIINATATNSSPSSSREVVLHRLSTGDASDCDGVLDSSWCSQDDINAIQPSITRDKLPGHSRSKAKKLYRSRSRRRGAKSVSRRKRKGVSPAVSDTKDANALGNYTLASTMMLNTRLESKKVETFSTKYNTKFSSTPRRSKPKATEHTQASPKLSLTTAALEKRTTPHPPPKEGRSSDDPVTMPTPRMVLEHAATVYGTGAQVSLRLGRTTKGADSASELHTIKKVFLSEKQSSALKDCGKLVPCAPPTSPTPEQLQRYEYVPSLTDLRSQRALKDRLSAMDAEEKKKRQRQREDRARQERQLMRSNISATRQRQRQEIYALNQAMTDHEHGEFLKFCEAMKKKSGKT